MLLPGENIGHTWLFFMVLATWIIAFGETIGDKTLNLKIGFDLTQGKNGAPSLRIRDFEDSDEYNPRALGEDPSDEKDISNRADSLGESDGKDSDKDGGRSGKSGDDDDDDYSENDKQRSTRGLNPGEYEPEDNPKLHGKYAESDSEPNSM